MTPIVMSSLIKAFVLLTLLGPCSLWGRENFMAPKLPHELSSVDSLIKEIKNPISLKLSDLYKNYRQRRGANTVEFSSHESALCNGEVREAESVLSRLQYTYRFEDSLKRHVHALRIYDCQNRLRLEEVISIKGGTRGELSFRQWSEGRFKVELNEDEESLYYLLKDGDSKELLSLSGRQETDRAVYEIKVLSELVLQVRYDFLSSESRAFFTFYGRKLNYRYRDEFSLSMSSLFPTFTYKAYAGTDGVRLLGSRDTLLSLNSFLSFFNIYALDLGVRQVKGIVDFHLSSLPSTEVIVSSGTNSALLEDLRVNLNRLINGLNLNLLELFIRDLIRFVEEGLIIDRRG